MSVPERDPRERRSLPGDHLQVDELQDWVRAIDALERARTALARFDAGTATYENALAGLAVAGHRAERILLGADWDFFHDRVQR